ncbi:hypothetical protein HYT55_05105 [Candidatus Woesearchaeota archaeon]|nr:hypothetical protein [Candidatus Woesearchaeota archaeon]
MLFEVVVVILVIGIALTVATRLGEPETMTKITAAEDMTMMVNVLVSMPGNVIVEYPRNMSLYALAFVSSSSLAIYEGDKSTDIDPALRMFLLPMGYTAVGFVKEKARVCLQKEGKKIILTECP